MGSRFIKAACIGAITIFAHAAYAGQGGDENPVAIWVESGETPRTIDDLKARYEKLQHEHALLIAEMERKQEMEQAFLQPLQNPAEEGAKRFYLDNEPGRRSAREHEPRRFYLDKESVREEVGGRWNLVRTQGEAPVVLDNKAACITAGESMATPFDRDIRSAFYCVSSRTGEVVEIEAH